MEEEARRNHCRRMISLIRSKQQHQESSAEDRRRQKHRGARGSQRTECEKQAVAGGEFQAHRDQTSPSLACQGPEVQPVPPQLISMLRLKTLKEEMRRAAEVELHDPAACSVCEQEQASLALESFIRRKRTQLRFQTLKGRLNTPELRRVCTSVSLCEISQSPWMPLAGFGRKHLVDICGSQQPGVALATAKERGVALATDEMRGYPDKNATGTHLASPRCPFSDR
ncbi:uncharacterized protein LOC121611880 isoform X2 [Chelmon rostratus]|nr:uncharacterized protein LOC121611880 isoform X2 [Chelmon rostratus]